MNDINKDIEIQALKAEIAKGLRRELMYADIVHQHTIAMRAAIVAANLESEDQGLLWIYNTLAGPGHLPDLNEAREKGGAQTMFDAEMEEHRAFREAHPAPTAEECGISAAAVSVLAERRRQIEAEGWTPEHDDAEHLPGELELAAASYVCADEGDAPPAIWPWSVSWWKPKSRRRNLVKACALALAAIEKYDRAEAKKQGANHAD